MHDPKGSLALITEALNDLNKRANRDPFTGETDTFMVNAIVTLLQPHLSVLEALLPKDKGDDQN